MKTKNTLILLLTACIWGVAFVAQSVGMDYIGPFTFNGVRNLVGAVTLLPCIAVLKKISPKENVGEKNRKTLFLGGIACGICLFLGSTLQQIGIQYTTAGKAGFITAFYIILVPVVGIFLKKKTGIRVWLAVVIALVGLYFLCMTEAMSIGKGDLYVLVGALAFTAHIWVIDYFASKVDGVQMSCIQFFVCGILCCIGMIAAEQPTISGIVAAGIPILYAGVLSCGVAYTLQIIGQKDMNPTVASIILSLESCVSVLAGWILLGEKLSKREFLGCILMFAAIVLAQLPERKQRT